MSRDAVGIRMGGHGREKTAAGQPPNFVGDGLAARFGGAVNIEPVWNIMQL